MIILTLLTKFEINLYLLGKSTLLTFPFYIFRLILLFILIVVLNLYAIFTESIGLRNLFLNLKALIAFAFDIFFFFIALKVAHTSFITPDA